MKPPNKNWIEKMRIKWDSSEQAKELSPNQKEEIFNFFEAKIKKYIFSQVFKRKE